MAGVHIRHIENRIKPVGQPIRLVPSSIAVSVMCIASLVSERFAGIEPVGIFEPIALKLVWGMPSQAGDAGERVPASHGHRPISDIAGGGALGRFAAEMPAVPLPS